MKIFYLFFLITSLSYSQKNSLTIEYQLFVNEEAIPNKNYYLDKLIEDAQDLLFYYKTDGKISELYLEEEGTQHVEIPLKVMAGITEPYFYMLNNYYKPSPSMIVVEKGKYLIVNKLPDQIWDITNETKEISGYIAYKAILKNSGTKYNFPTTVWFTPDIPFKTNFKNYNGLPGVILEVHEEYIAFAASKIDFINQIDIKIPELPQITPEQFKEEFDKIKNEYPELFPKNIFK